MPTKASTIPQDSTNSKQVEDCKTKSRIRKETKRAKSHMVRVTKDFPKISVMEADTLYEAYLALKTKYFVTNNR